MDYAKRREKRQATDIVMKHRGRFLGSKIVLATILLVGGLCGSPVEAQLTLASDMVLDSEALLMPIGSTYGPAINGLGHQSEALLTRGDYQYATWYHNGPDDEYVYVARRHLSGTNWEVIDDLGITFDRGDGNAWDNHNVIAMGVADNGTVHLAYDHHGHTLRYTNSAAGAATSGTWNASLFNSEQNALNVSDANLTAVTYPRFVDDTATGTTHFIYRSGGSGNGDLHVATYDPTSSTWGPLRNFIDGDAGTYVDSVGSSNNRNAYLNGVDVDASGRMHITWTWRESAGGTNHDIMYAYSDDGGDTWKNNAGVTVGTPGSPMDLDSPGITVVPMDRTNTLMNQQTQTVDADGAVHTVMWHRADGQPPTGGFTTSVSAYYHYFRDPGKTLLADYFDGQGLALNGASPDRARNGATWEAGDTFLDSGIAGTTVAGEANGQAAHLDFTPEAGKVYTAEATIVNNESNWVGFGFLPSDPSSGDWSQTSFEVRHSNAPGYAWMLSRDSTGNDQEGFLGTGTTGAQAWNGDVVDPTAPVDMKIVLDTRDENWTVEWFLNGESQGTPVAYGSTGNPGIGGIGFSHDRSDTSNGGATITNFSLKEGETVGEWVRNELPTERAVGSRPDMGYDEAGNLYAVYLSPGEGDGQGVTADYYTNGDLIIAAASKATRWQDWEIVYTDSADFVGEPRLDTTRLVQDGILSIFVQENGGNIGTPTGSALHVYEFDRLAQHVVWAGTDAAEWNNDATSDWDSEGDDFGDATFQAGYRVTFDDGGTSLNLQITEAVAPSSTVFRNTSGSSYSLSGQPIAGTGDLRLIGGGDVHLNNGANTYSGDTIVDSGTLYLQGDTSLVSPNIRVAAGAALDASGTISGNLALVGQNLTVDGQVAGNVQASSGSTVALGAAAQVQGAVSVSGSAMLSGQGTITGNLQAIGGVVRVGGVGLSTTGGTSSTVIDDFESGLSGYTSTIILDTNGGGSNFASWQIDQGRLQYVTTFEWGSTVEQSAYIRNGLALDVGQEVQVDLDHTNASQDIGLYVGGTSPTTGVRENYVNIYARAGGGLFSRGFLGENELNLQSGGSPSFDQLFIKRVGTDDYELGYYNGTNRVVLTTRNGMTGNDGSVVGFYTDVRNEGELGLLDNFTIVETGVLQYQGETLLVEGDAEFDSLATLQLDIATPNGSDLLMVTGNMQAGGTLEVTLDDEAPAPSLGDGFDLLDFASAGGAFDDFVLPLLSTGLAWNTTQLLENGLLSVGLAGDYNGDGAVNLADYTVWRNNLGGNWISNRDSGLFGAIGVQDYDVWKQNFGLTMVSGAVHTSAAVPEPSTLWLVALTLGITCLVRGYGSPGAEAREQRR